MDWEYAGLGFKEQDIAWSLIVRPTQKFMKSKEEWKAFLDGYKSENDFNFTYLKWCLINGSLHFYLMNRKSDNILYLQFLKKIINNLIESRSLFNI